jgi:hypothetical protein
MNKKYRVHLGYTRTGRNRWSYFLTVEEAMAFANDIFHRTGVVVSVEANKGAR